MGDASYRMGWAEVKMAPRISIYGEAEAQAIERLCDAREAWLIQRDAHEGKDWVLRWDNDAGKVSDIYFIRDLNLAMLFKLTWGGQ